MNIQLTVTTDTGFFKDGLKDGVSQCSLLLDALQEHKEQVRGWHDSTVKEHALWQLNDLTEQIARETLDALNELDQKAREGRGK